MFVEGHIETTNLWEIIASQCFLVSIRRKTAAYSTSGLLFKQSVRWVDGFQPSNLSSILKPAACPHAAPERHRDYPGTARQGRCSVRRAALISRMSGFDTPEACGTMQCHGSVGSRTTRRSGLLAPSSMRRLALDLASR